MLAGLALLLLVQSEQPIGAADLYRRVAKLPLAVREVIERRAMCNHRGGEEPYDAERRRQIDEA